MKWLRPAGDAIIARRLQLGLSQIDLARDAPISRSYLKDLENGTPNRSWRGTASERVLIKIAKVLQCHIGDITLPDEDTETSVAA